MVMTKEKKKRQRNRTKFIIDRALVALRDAGVRDFTSLDVESKELELGYKYCPSKNHVSHRLVVLGKRGLIEMAREKKNGLPNVWRFNSKSGGIKRLYIKRLNKMRRERRNSMNNSYCS